MPVDKDEGFQSLGSLFAVKRPEEKKPPAYQWQDLALRVVKELSVPPFKKASVFKICRDNPKEFVEMCLNDTKELCQSGERWKYFFKVAAGKGKPGEEKTK